MINLNKHFFKSVNPLGIIWESIPVSIHYKKDSDYISISCNEDTTLKDFLSYLKEHKKNFGNKLIKNFKMRYRFSNDTIVFNDELFNIILYTNPELLDRVKIEKLFAIKSRYLEDTESFRLTTKEKNFLIKMYDMTLTELYSHIEKLEITNVALKNGKRKNF